MTSGLLRQQPDAEPEGSAYPAAPYPSETRARGWRFELDLERMRQSDTWALAGVAGPEYRPWLLLLWATAWDQSPCGAFPDDDALIAARLNMPLVLFAAMRPVLMRGWRLHADGRLYHETITEIVLAMLAAKEKEKTRKAEWRARQSADVPRDTVGTDAGATGQSTVSDDTGTGTGTGEKKPSASPATPTVPCPYDRIVALYHEHLPDLPSVKLMPEGRRKAMRTFWVFVLTSKRSNGTARATNADEALAWIAEYFDRAKLNDFLMGRGERSGVHGNWRCDLDFLMTDKGRKHVIERTEDAA